MSRKFIAFMLGTFILVGGAFLFVLRWGSQLSATPVDLLGDNGARVTPAPPEAPKTPEVNLSVLLGKKGNTLVVTWANLPNDTYLIDIFRSLKNKDAWSLWKTIHLLPSQLGSGRLEFNIGKSTLSDYSFRVEAIGTGGGGGNGADTSPAIIWVATSTPITVVTSTTPVAPPVENPAPTSTAPAPTSTLPVAPPPPSSTPAAPSVPSGTPYYTPQLQISGYSQGQTGSFWVQHVDQKIQVGWQNLPTDTSRIEISRTLDPNGGSWSIVLAQDNPTVASYAIQLVDDTLGQAYYYKLDARQGSTTLATYGPIYLPPVGQ